MSDSLAPASVESGQFRACMRAWPRRRGRYGLCAALIKAHARNDRSATARARTRTGSYELPVADAEQTDLQANSQR
jgi:hypothetical protein